MNKTPGQDIKCKIGAFFWGGGEIKFLEIGRYLIFSWEDRKNMKM